MTLRRRLGSAILFGLLMLLVPAVSATGREDRPTEVKVSLSGTLEASTSHPGQTSGSYKQTVSVKFSESQDFHAGTGDPIGKPKLQVSGTETFFNDTTFEGTQEGTPQDNCTGKLSPKPYRQWSHIALMSGSIDQYDRSRTT
jgi:hypothetical protein